MLQDLLSDIPTLDPRDVFYTAVGIALLGLTIQPALQRFRIVNIPLYYVAFGAVVAGIGLPVIDPRRGGLESVVIEHVSELIVIISLTGAGLAIDTHMSWRNWQPAFRLLIVTMPLTIAGVAVLGWFWVGLALPSAMLLAAALAPTDPVLARTVQVAPPGEDESPVEVALTVEAGMNDGLAFPFIYLAIHIAAMGWVGLGVPEWFWSWLSFDLAYRVVAGILGGYAVGWAITKLAFSKLGDARRGAWNAIVMVLAATLLSYGAVEAIDGYGFLAVFFAARAGRRFMASGESAGYERFVHHGADQLESILLALLLLWLGTFVGSGGMSGLTWPEVGFAAALLLVLRPLAGFAGLIGYRAPLSEKAKVAFFGVRGMGSIFYIAYAQNHAEFGQIDAVWRISALVIVASIALHGYAAPAVIPPSEEADTNPHAKREEQSSKA